MSLGKLLKSEYGFVWRCAVCNNRKVTFTKAYPDICSKTHITFSQLLLLLIYYLPNQISSSIIQKSRGISERQVTTVKKLWQEIIKKYYINLYSKKKIGGKNKVVEVDESSFKRKYRRGRMIKRSQWVVGLTERGGGFESTILILVQQPNAETLMFIIEMYVDKQTEMINTDSWRVQLIAIFRLSPQTSKPQQAICCSFEKQQ
ncbi:DDE family transposase [Tetrahymena thermophila SB210]|uniref:DDE family transposase n=1 Tax=Tetrahymena thermophila (strain SB210) TaxID=312017 RepID=A0A1B9C2I7_TETTS|nr:DDE family transposase [Tetrahymena thermophila SB210]